MRPPSGQRLPSRPMHRRLFSLSLRAPSERRSRVAFALLPALAAAAAFGLAACSSSPSTTASSATTSTTSTTNTSTSPSADGSGTIATIPAAQRSPAGTWGKPPTVIVPAGTPPTELQSADLIKGTGEPAEAGDVLTVQYTLATYSSGKVVQSSWTSKPFTFTLGVGDVIPGWDKGVVGMQQGGRRELIIPPSLGYGAASPGPGIAANDTLVFVVDLLDLKAS
jgi:peptidylprolyl isomerase